MRQNLDTAMNESISPDWLDAFRDLETRVFLLPYPRFYQELADWLCRHLSVEYVLISEVGPGSTGSEVRTLAASRGGRQIENFSYRMVGTPCAEAILQGFFHGPSKVAEQFPKDPLLVKIGADSYMGICVRDDRYQCRGLITLVDTKPLANPALAEALLRFAGEQVGRMMERTGFDSFIREREAWFGNFIEGCPLGVHLYTLEPDGRLVLAGSNRAADRITGLRTAELHFQTIEQAFPPLAGTDIPNRYRQVARTGQAWQETDFSYHEDRLQGVYDIYAFPTGPNRMAVMFNDVTARQQAGEILKLAKDKAESAARAKDQFLAMMSHEMRSPLNPILGFARLLLSEIDHEEHRQALEYICSSADQLLQMIEQLLEYSRYQSAEVQRHDRCFRLGEVSQHLIEAWRTLAGTNELGCAFETAPSAHYPISAGTLLLGDSSILRQILTNLLNNACKFTSHGKIILRCTLLDLTGDRGRFAFAVEDNGIGIPKESLPSIFQPFYQVHQSDTRPHTGVGLGLAIVTKLAQALEGQITVSSTEGIGSTFTLEVPLTIVNS